MSLFTKNRLGILFVTLPTLFSSSFVLTSRTVVVVERPRPIFSTKTDNAIQNDVDLSQLTVVALKDRLRQMNLPLGGKKTDLVKRLLEYSDADEQLPDTFEPNQEDAASSNEEKEDDIYNLTVPALKERLRELGLSVGGRKADLIERLLEANDDKDDSHTEYEVEREDKAEKETDKEHEMEIEPSDDDLINLDLSTDANRSESSARRAKRKKFWKTQEVRELIKQNDRNAIAKAEEMITQLELMAAEEGEDEYLPGPIQYTALIEAYSHCGASDAPQRAEKVINRLLSANSKAAKPTTPMLNASKYLLRNDCFLQCLITNISSATNSQLSGHTRPCVLNQAPNKPQLYWNGWSILKTCKSLIVFIMLPLFLNSHEIFDSSGDGTVKPSVHSFAITINAWSNVGSETAAHNAEEILKRLLEDYDEALEQNAEYAKELKPNNVVFNSVIDAWARSGSSIAGERAESILLRMEALSMTEIYDVRPDTITFNTCSKCSSLWFQFALGTLNLSFNSAVLAIISS